MVQGFHKTLWFGVMVAVAAWLNASAFAAPVELTIHEVTAPAGAQIRVPIDIALHGNAPDTLLLHINYDDTVLTPLSIINGDGAVGKTIDGVAEAGVWTIIVYSTGTSHFVDGGELLELLFALSASGGGTAANLSDAGSDGSTIDADPIDVSVSTAALAIGPGTGQHSADTSRNWRFSLSEMVRVVQLFNSDGYHCDAAAADGYGPGAGGETCTPHDSDFDPPNWVIGLDELQRLIDLYTSSDTYSIDSTSADGFAPGPF